MRASFGIQFRYVTQRIHPSIGNKTRLGKGRSADLDESTKSPGCSSSSSRPRCCSRTCARSRFSRHRQPVLLEGGFCRLFRHPGGQEIIPFLAQAIDRRSPPQVVENAPPARRCAGGLPDLDLLPILRHCEKDGGNYISSGRGDRPPPAFTGRTPISTAACSFLAAEMAVRVVRGRHFDAFLQELGQVDVAICVGNSPNVLAAAATSLEIGVDELEVANALEPLQVVRARSVDVYGAGGVRVCPGRHGLSRPPACRRPVRRPDGDVRRGARRAGLCAQGDHPPQGCHLAGAAAGRPGAQAADGHAARADDLPQGERGRALPGCQRRPWRVLLAARHRADRQAGGR